MASQSRKHRGYRTQAVVAAWFAARGWPFAESTGASRQGADITGTPDIAVEVKARRAFNPLEWIRQARAAADSRLPFVVFRCDGQGETTVHEWPVLIRLEDFTQLLHEAGYGDTTAVDVQVAGRAREGCEHSWEDETTVEDPVRRLLCIHCHAAQEEPR